MICVFITNQIGRRAGNIEDVGPEFCLIIKFKLSEKLMVSLVLFEWIWVGIRMDQ